MRTTRRAALLLLVSLAAAGCGGTIDSRDDEVAATTDMLAGSKGVVVHPAESTEDIANPERGFYLRYELARAGDASWVRSAGYTLAIGMVDLRAYRDSDLPASLLAQVNAGFAQARAAGIKIVLRFAYNDSFGPDASRARVLGHIAQLAPVMQANEDVIAVVQAGFVGAWGEWHSSTNGLTAPDARHDIIAALLAAVPGSRSVQLRKPAFKRDFVGDEAAVGADEAFTGTARARLGHHNDCFLASADDLGTYEAPIARDMDYVADDSAYVPMGGETCGVFPARTSCAAAMGELAAHHWSYLNREYHQGVIDGWVRGGCEQEIRRDLGYRFVATRVAYSSRVAPGGVLALQVDVANRGYAVPMNARPVEVVLTGADGARHVARLDYDARALVAGDETTLAARLRIPADLAAGTYALALRLPDAAPSLAGDARYAIQLANTGTWDASTGDNVLTRDLAIDPAARGEVDATATTFAAL